jgi:predicted GNAT superfamily acetyltransferase
VIGTVLVRAIGDPAAMTECERLYREVMGLRPEDGSINPRLLTALQHNSGLVVGAYADDRMVGFAYSFLARELRRDPPELYQYSQLAVVAQDLQGRGIGRQLKFAQREHCLRQGVELMRWAFDPMKTRNAHFNLDVLGGRVTEFVPAMYGATGFGSDAADASDRFIVTWPLASSTPVAPEPVRRQSDDAPGTVRADGDHRLVMLPADWAAFRRSNLEQAARLRARVNECFVAALDEGQVGISCNPVGPGLMAYRFAPDEQGVGSWRTAC